MISLVPAILKIGPWLLAAVCVAFGLFRHQQAKADVADADKEVAEAHAKVAQSREADAQASVVALQAGSDAAAARTDVDSVVAGMPAQEVRDELQDWTRGS